MKRKNLNLKSYNLDEISKSNRKPWFHRSKGRRHRNHNKKITSSQTSFTSDSPSEDTQADIFTQTRMEESSSDRLNTERTETSSTQSFTERIRLYKSIHDPPKTERSPHQYPVPDISFE
ncbi:unnamed protein product [Arctia plantaginis]|uniref:Uncharacterized protein n=1 Tax=Arctia plantaginis TaxID=874455 RepID=A0A8S1AK70_ARCPL|nr:unnamed protein product [Arctia plantaginis]